jgi:hypothetical protein
MKTQVNDFEVRIRWQYGVNHPETMKPNETRCIITTESLTHSNSEPTIHEGSTFKSKKDPFCKETARRLSLERASRIFDRPLRTIVWNFYWSRKPQKIEKHVVETA